MGHEPRTRPKFIIRKPLRKKKPDWRAGLSFHSPCCAEATSAPATTPITVSNGQLVEAML